MSHKQYFTAACLRARACVRGKNGFFTVCERGKRAAGQTVRRTVSAGGARRPRRSRGGLRPDAGGLQGPGAVLLGAACKASSALVAGVEQQGRQHRKEDGCGDPGGALLQAARQRPQQSLLGDGFPDPTGQQAAEAGQRHRSPGPGEIDEGLVPAQRPQQQAGLPITGIADGETLARLYADDAPRTAMAQATAQVSTTTIAPETTDAPTAAE